MPPERKPVHDRKLFDEIVSRLRVAEPVLRPGAMFGCPAAFIGKRLAFCVYGTGIGARLPPAEAARLIASGEATAFRPFGRPAMKEWIELRPRGKDVQPLLPILAEALRYAQHRA